MAYPSLAYASPAITAQRKMTLLKQHDYGVELKFGNYRTN